MAADGQAASNLPPAAVLASDEGPSAPRGASTLISASPSRGSISLPPGGSFLPSDGALSGDQQKVVLKLLAMNDEKTKQKAIEAVADIYGMCSLIPDFFSSFEIINFAF
ncbi:hypothetical protein KSP40_PGU014482 [Platanthera guangdongensis]|uniref:Uncharacterized protein n=1 Tax=Platanthera guangdongensis TaxID=2320717 RepID=A0ABR2MQH6_9ASPA